MNASRIAGLNVPPGDNQCVTHSHQTQTRRLPSPTHQPQRHPAALLQARLDAAKEARAPRDLLVAAIQHRRALQALASRRVTRPPGRDATPKQRQMPAVDLHPTAPALRIFAFGHRDRSDAGHSSAGWMWQQHMPSLRRHIAPRHPALMIGRAVIIRRESATIVLQFGVLF